MHPRKPHARPVNNPIRRRIITRLGMRTPSTIARPATATTTPSFPPLLPQRRTILLLNEAIILALNPLKATALPIRKLPIKALAHLLPLLPQIHAMVPDKIHFFLVVFGTGRTAAFGGGGGAAAGDGGEAFSAVGAGGGVGGAAARVVAV